MNQELQGEIESLRQLKQEGEYWDFKRQWYEQNQRTDLLHDIICMANNLVNRNAYIIIGVDEERDYCLCDVSSDPNRRSTQDLVKFLRDKRFSGGIRPSVVVESVHINNTTIDVLIIKNSNYTPYFLIERFEGVHANSIYTRVMDTNTPIDKTADVNNIEYLWKKRFGLVSSVQDRLFAVLSDTTNWIVDWGNKDYAYNVYAPEFRIVRVDDYTEGWLPQSAFYAHPCGHFAKLNIMYHNTIIYETGIWAFDQFRKYLPQARNYYVEEIGNFWYSYYDLSSVEGKLLTIFTHGTNSIVSREIDFHQFLIFDNDDERDSFHHFLVENFSNYSDDSIREHYKYQIQEDEKEAGSGGFSAFQVGKAATIYSDWLKQKSI